MTDIKSLLFFLVVFVSNVIQCITGFAGTVLAMPFSVMLIGFDRAKAVLNILGILASVGVVIMNRKALNRREFLKITGIMLVSMAIGILILHSLSVPAEILYKVLGVTVLLFTVLGCVHTFRKKSDLPASEIGKKAAVLEYLILLAAGVVHGMFVCGGPLLILYASERLSERDEFRATVSAVWIVLNSVILLTDIHASRLNTAVLPMLGVSAVLLFAAVLVGNAIAEHMNKKAFSAITYVLMGISAVSLLLK